MDFTLKTYRILLYTLKSQDFSFLTFEGSLSCLHERRIVLRHDVDLLPSNSLEFARIQSEQGISGSYYFRFVPRSYNESIIKEIRDLGHEIGYHYETMDTCKGNVDQAYNLFCNNLEKLRKLVPVKTICMHGSPLSKFDNRKIWQKYDYRTLGLIGEPYFDVDFDEVFYLTDTGRRWDGDSVNLRDKAEGMKGRSKHSIDSEIAEGGEGEKGGEENRVPRTTHLVPFPSFHTTFDIIKSARENKLPSQIMMTFHPQRWSDKTIPWVRELVWQNTKNVFKYFIVKTTP